MHVDRVVACAGSPERLISVKEVGGSVPIHFRVSLPGSHHL